MVKFVDARSLYDPRSSEGLDGGLIRVGIYQRISKDAEEKGLGVARQETDNRALAKRKGWQVELTLTDNDISAARINGRRKTRPAYKALLAAVKNGEIDAVISWELDRLVRDPLELEEFFLICEQANMHLFATTGDNIDIGSGEGMMIARVKAAVAAEEIRKLRKRSKRKHLELAEAGLPSGGGHRPYGYDQSGMKLERSEAARVREAARRVLRGETVHSIAASWNAKGITNSKGKFWRSNKLDETLRRPRIAGLRTYRGEIVGEAAWPAIISVEEWEDLQAVLDCRPVVRRRTTGEERLLSGLLRCGKCGSRMYHSNTDGRTPRGYVCPPRHLGGCRGVRCAADPLETLVERMLLTTTPDSAPRPPRGPKGEIGEVELAIRSLREQMAELAEMWSARSITVEEWRAARAPLEAEAKRLEARRNRMIEVATRPEPLPPRERLVRLWAKGDVEARRHLVTQMFTGFVIHPSQTRGPRFDPDRVEPLWVEGVEELWQAEEAS